jgi:hypothetical protein
MSIDSLPFGRLASQQRALADLSLRYVEQVRSLQLELLGGYTEAALDGMRALVSAEDSTTLQAYLKEQPARGNAMAERVRADLERFTDLNVAFYTDLMDLGKQAPAPAPQHDAVPPAAPVQKAAAKITA